MSPALDAWIEATERRRGRALRGPFTPGLVPDPCLDPPAALRAAAEALVGLVGERRVAVGQRPGLSYTDFAHMFVNLDGSVLEGDPPSLESAEHLLGIATHEGAHVLLTELPPKKAGRLFHWIHNVIEDERIECEVASSFPALAYPLVVLREKLIRVPPCKPGPLEALFALVRGPEHLKQAGWAGHEELLLNAMRILEPFPCAPEQVRKAVREIIECLPDGVEQQLPRGPGHVCTRGRRTANSLTDFNRRRSRQGRFRWRGGAGEVGTQPEVVWVDATPDPPHYEEVRREIARDAVALAARLEGLLPRRSQPRLPRGRLDRRRLTRLHTDGRIFRGPDQRPQRLALALIIDLSLSMEGSSARKAQRIAILLAEACAAVPGACLYAYGHNADQDGTRQTRITRYATSAHGRAETLGSLQVGGNNRDAHAIDVIGHDLLAREGAKHTPRLAIVLSDALPNADQFKGNSAVDATHKALEWFEQVWGPTLFWATEPSPVLRSLATGPILPCDPGKPLKGLMLFAEMYLPRS